MNDRNCKSIFTLPWLGSFVGVLKVILYGLVLTSCLLSCGEEREKRTTGKDFSAFALKYGDEAPLFAADDIYGDKFDMRDARGKTMLLEFFSFEAFHKTPAFWRYSDVLAQRYKDDDFVSVIVLNDESFEISKLKETLAESEAELPIFLAWPEKVNDLFGLEPGSVALVLIDSTSVIRFARPALLSNDTKRQLVEKFVLGKIRYTFDKEDSLTYPFRVGGKMPDLNLEQMGTGKKLMLSQLCSEPTISFLFTARCSRCEIKKFLNALAQIEECLKSELAGENMLMILTHDLGKEELENYLKDSKISIPAYQTADLRNLTGEYVTRKTEALRPKVIFVDQSGTIRYLKNLSDFRLELKNKSVDFQALQRKGT
jgi:hypothetical protein